MSSPKVSIPQTNFKQQQKQTLKGLQGTAQGFFNLNSRFARPYTELNLNTLRDTLYGTPNAPGELGLLTNANTVTRGADIADILRYGPAGYAALMRANPGLAMTLANANKQGIDAFAPGGLLDQLRHTAGDQLALGDRLSPQEETAVREGTRSGFSDLGMAHGTPALGAELLNRDQYAQQRLGQRIGYATSVEGLAGQDRDQLNRLVQTNASIYDPSQQVLGRGSSSISGLLGGGGVNPLSLMGTTNTSQLYNPQQGQDAFNTNTNAQAAAAISNSNSSGALTGSLIGGGAAIAGGLLVAL